MAKAKAIKVGAYSESGSDQGPQVDDLQFKHVMGYIEKGKALQWPLEANVMETGDTLSNPLSLLVRFVHTSLGWSYCFALY